MPTSRHLLGMGEAGESSTHWCKGIRGESPTEWHLGEGLVRGKTEEFHHGTFLVGSIIQSLC